MCGENCSNIGVLVSMLFSADRFFSRKILRAFFSLAPQRELFQRPPGTLISAPESSSSCSRYLGKSGLLCSSSSSLQISFCSRYISLMSSKASQSEKSVHDFSVKDIHGEDVDLSIYQGKVLLIVNVASQCGLTNSNYTELSELYEKYKDKGLEILAFPCNQFGGQEPGSNEEIVEFACTRFKAEYPIFDKIDVNGENSASIYKFLKASKGGLLGSDIKWNFAKFLVDKDGNVVDRYGPTTSPRSIEKDIKKLLGSSEVSGA